MVDLIIRNANVYDGNGGDAYVADILVKHDRIYDIGNFMDVHAKQTIDAKGLATFPGFIDTHTHSDAILLKKPHREEALLQGITTEITGSCGIGVLPMTKVRKDYIKTVKGIVGDVDLSTKFTNIDEYINAVGNTGINYAVQAAHSPIRAEAVGMSDVYMDDLAMSKLIGITEKMFEDGACALSTGLAYYPASFSNTNELVELCRVAKKFNAPITVHLRSVINKYFDKATFDAVDEIIKAAKESGVKLHFSHRRTRADNFGNAEGITRVIEDGRKNGLTITADFYPYPVGCGYVAVYLPLWVMDGGYDNIMERLNNDKTRKKIALDMERTVENLENGVFISSMNHSEYIGKTYSEVALETGETVAEMLVRFLSEEKLDGGYRPIADFSNEEIKRFEADCAFLIKQPYYMIGSDTLPMHTFVHPRTTSTFPKMLRIAREHNVDLSTLANRFSALPADVFAIKDRGRIVKGGYADITIFDKDKVCENSNFDEPTKQPTGIKYVIVNGKIAVDNGICTDNLAGVPIKRG